MVWSGPFSIAPAQEGLMQHVGVAGGHRLGFQTLEEESTIDSLPVEGSLPDWLAGTLLRTGPPGSRSARRATGTGSTGLRCCTGSRSAGTRSATAIGFCRARRIAPPLPRA